VRFKRLTRSSKNRLLPSTVKKFGPNVVLQLSHLLTESGLSEMKTLRGTGEVPLAGSFQEVFELVEFHRYLRLP
jgi:hypothetical protein